MEEKLSYIYAIHCPLSHHIVYVGRSIHPGLRLYQHSRDRYSLIGWWFKAMKSLGFKPYMSILADCSGEWPCIVEMRYITKYRELQQANHNRDHMGRKCNTTLHVVRPASQDLADLKSVEVAIMSNVNNYKFK